jgi:hypothetical protein
MSEEKPIKPPPEADPPPAGGETPKEEKPGQAQGTGGAAPEGEKKGAEFQFARHEEHPMPMLHATPAAAGPERERPEEKGATFSGFGGFIRLAFYVLVRGVKLAGMKSTLSRLQAAHDDAFVLLGRRAIEMKIAHPQIAPLASQIESLETEIAAKRSEARAVEAEPLSDDPQVRSAELKLRRVKTNKLNEAVQGLESKARPLLDEVGRIVHRAKLEPEGLEQYYTRILEAATEIKNQERRIDEINAEYEVVSPGTRFMAYGFWVAIVVVILAALIVLPRGCSKGEVKAPTKPAAATKVK